MTSTESPDFDLERDKMAGRNMALVLAGGTGSRMNSETPKQFMLIQGKPLLYYTIEAFERCEDVQDIIIVCGEDMIARCQREVVDPFSFSKVRRIVAGGKERYHSSYAGISGIQEKCDLVFIHDGARPCITPEIISATAKAAAENGSAIAAVKVKDTIIKAKAPGSLSEAVVDRSELWQVQTPQTFHYELLREAFEKFAAEGFGNVTDDAMVVEQMTGVKTRIVTGSYENIKVTTTEDLGIAKVFLGAQGRLSQNPKTL